MTEHEVRNRWLVGVGLCIVGLVVGIIGSAILHSYQMGVVVGSQIEVNRTTTERIAALEVTAGERAKAIEVGFKENAASHLGIATQLGRLEGSVGVLVSLVDKIDGRLGKVPPIAKGAE
jgi:hypothetical protein